MKHPRFNSATPAVQYWKASDTGPTERERRILRRIAANGLVLAFQNGGASFTFGDGVPVRAEFNFDFRLFRKFEALNWIAPDPRAPGLFLDALAQRYVAPGSRP